MTDLLTKVKASGKKAALAQLVRYLLLITFGGTALTRAARPTQQPRPLGLIDQIKTETSPMRSAAQAKVWTRSSTPAS
jgi:hypothetical protein